MTEPRTANGRATRSRIVSAASELVAQRGVADTSIDDVRRRAGASKSQLYLYFDGRDDLLRAVARDTCDNVLALQAEALDGFDSLAGLRRYLDALVAGQVDRDARGGCPVGSLAGQLADRDEHARLILADGLAEWEARLRRGLETMRDRGELSAGADPGRLATQILAAIQGGLLLTQVRRDPAALRAAADAALASVRAASRDPKLT